MAENGDTSTRDRLALCVFWGSIALLGIVTVVLLYSSQSDRREVFNAILPLIGTWIGTILAFYFTQQNFESASRAVQQVAKLSIDDRLRKKNVVEVMLPLTKIETAILPAAGAGGLPVADLLKLLSGPVTRIPVVDASNVVKYIIHQSMLYKYIAESTMATPGWTIASKTLADFLAHDGMQAIVSLMAFVGVDKTLADAKASMEAKPGCQDVFVTKTGSATEAVEGWITNVDVADNAKV